LAKSERQLKTLTRESKNTADFIDKLKKDQPNTFAKLDNLTNEVGQEVDVLMHVTNNVPGPNDGATSHSFENLFEGLPSDLTKDHTHYTPATNGYGTNTIEVFLSDSPSSKERTTMSVLNHERGHVVYQAENTTAYYEYLKNKGKLGKSYDGHASDDPSGKAATAAENKKDKF